MANLTLYIGDKNFSSWSLRPWLVLKQSGIAFDEVVIHLRRPDTRPQILKVCPTGHVPMLRHGTLLVWESLAICEYLAELYPQAHLWPQDLEHRATARALSCEMHAGFSALRQELPLNVTARTPKTDLSEAAQADIARVAEIWREQRARFQHRGPFLFGEFSITDAMFAPLALRFITYGVTLDAPCTQYMLTLLHLKPMQEWIAGAEQEKASGT